jgi:ribosome modulation factor
MTPTPSAREPDYQQVARDVIGERTWLSPMSAAELNARDAYLELQFGAVLEAAHRAGYQAALREVRKELAGYDVHEIRRGTPDPVVDGWADGHAYGYRQLRDDFCAWLDTALGAEGEQEK